MHKFGREFSAAVMENRDGIVTERVSPVAATAARLIYQRFWTLGLEKVVERHPHPRTGQRIPRGNSESI